MTPEEREFIAEQVGAIAIAIDGIARGGREIGGLEGLAVAIAGYGLETPLARTLAEALDGINGAITIHSNSVDELANALNRLAGSGER